MANIIDIIRPISKSVRLEMIRTFEDIDRDQYGVFCEYYNLPFSLSGKKNNEKNLIKFIKELRSIQHVPYAFANAYGKKFETT